MYIYILYKYIGSQGFMVSGHFLFGAKLREFATLSSSFATVVNGMTLGLDYSLLASASEVDALLRLY
jgi:hypothetical protein